MRMSAAIAFRHCGGSEGWARLRKAQQAPSWTVPPEKERCPSKWGAGDERGSGNHMNAAAV